MIINDYISSIELNIIKLKFWITEVQELHFIV